MRLTKHTTPTRLASLLTIAIGLAIAAFTLTPIAPNTFSGSDKTHHSLAFFVLALPLSAARPKIAILVAMSVFTYGGLIELIQPFVGRHRDVADIIANGLGAMAGAVVGYALSIRLQPKNGS
jgi:VanZ family protein